MDLMVFQDIPLCSIFVLKRHLLAEAYACVFKNDCLLAAPCVCCADVPVSGATLLTQTPRLTSHGCWITALQI